MTSSPKGLPKFNPFQDILSGLIISCSSIPQLIAYAETAGYASYRGLSTAGPTLLLWGITTGSPWLNSGVTAITALMTKSDLNAETYVETHGEEEYVKLVACYSICVGLASLAMAVLGVGKIVRYVPKPVKIGFKWGCSFGVVLSALPAGLLTFGSGTLKSIVATQDDLQDWIAALTTAVPVANGASSTLKLLYILSKPSLLDTTAILIFLSTTIFIMNRSRVLPSWVPPASEVLIATAAATLYSSQSSYAGGIVGEIPPIEGGIAIGPLELPLELLNPAELMQVPLVAHFGGILNVILSATLFASLNFLSLINIAAIFETENAIPYSSTRELFAQGISCLGAGAVGSAPVSGSLSRSLISRMTGTTSKLSCIVTALAWMTMMPYMSIMSATPRAALSGIIMSAVIKGVVYPKDLVGLKGEDRVVGLVTALVTAFTTPTIGFGSGIAVAIAMRPFAKTKQE